MLEVYGGGTICGRTYACAMASRPTRLVRTRLYRIVRRKMSPSAPTLLTPAAPTDRFCGLIILPMTPPEELVAAVRIGLRPCSFAVWACSGPDRVLDEGSLPVRETPRAPRDPGPEGESRP